MAYSCGRFDKEQLVFIVETVFKAAWDRIDAVLPHDDYDARAYDRSPAGRRMFIAGCVDSVGAALPILYAQITGDGMGIGDFRQFDEFKDLVEHFIDARSKLTGLRPGGVRDISERFVSEYFSQYLRESPREGVLALECFSGGVISERIAASLVVSKNELSKLLKLAEIYRSSPAGLTRMEFEDPSPLRWFIDSDDASAKVCEFVKGAKRFAVVSEAPGRSNLVVANSTVQLNGQPESVYFSWNAVLADRGATVHSHAVPVSVLVRLRDSL